MTRCREIVTLGWEMYQPTKILLLFTVHTASIRLTMKFYKECWALSINNCLCTFPITNGTSIGPLKSNKVVLSV